MITTFSSGDLTADRRADYARMLVDSGDPAAAAELMAQALDLVPNWAAGWFSLGILREKAGDAEGAAVAFRNTLEVAEEDVFGAEMRLAALGRAALPEAPPAAYVEKLFDDYAERFDAALVEGLGYSIPEKLTTLLFAEAPVTFASAIDLGCGTGLIGERLRSKVSHLAGYDISRGMLAKAAEKGIYDRLAQADLLLEAAAGGVPQLRPDESGADLVTAGDVLMYFGNLDPVFATAVAITAPGGYFAFSVEDGAEDAEWQLRPSLRFAHGERYVLRLAAEHGFEVIATERTPIRRDGAETIIGLLVVARRLGRTVDDAAGRAAVLPARPGDPVPVH